MQLNLNLATAILYHLLLLLRTTSAHNTAARLLPSEINMTVVISRMPQCKVFARTLLANAEVLKTYQDNVDGGITMFCPLDDQFEAFLPKFRNLTVVSQKCFLEFFAVPYYQSLPMLKSNNGFLKTLAKNFEFTVQNDGQDVTLKTKLTTAKITGTLLDEPPLAIHTIDRVQMPEELFSGHLVPARAQAPESIAGVLVPVRAQPLVGIAQAPAPAPAQPLVGIATQGMKQRDAASCECSTDQVPDEDNSVLKLTSGSCGVIVLSLFLGILL